MDGLDFVNIENFGSNIVLKTQINSIEKFKKNILKKIPDYLNEYETILGDPFFINQFRFSKFFKKNFKKMILNPSLFFDKNKRSIKFHFDMMHGDGNLKKAINLMDRDDKDDFEFFVNSEVSFNPT